MRIFALSLFLLINSTLIIGQPIENFNLKGCSSDELLKQRLATDINFKEKHFKKQALFNSKRASLLSQKNHAQTLYTIPTVIHIVHDGDAIGTDANPNDIDVLENLNDFNLRLRHNHADADIYTAPYDTIMGQDVNVEFCLVSVDPIGNTNTGINRYNNPALAITTEPFADAALLVDIAWDPTRYCNLFILEEINQCGYYTSGPDVVVFDSGCFWDGLMAHEVGHYLSLNHPFYSQDCYNDDCTLDGDGICDTPAKSIAGFAGGNCTYPDNNCLTDEADSSLNNPYRSTALGGLGEQPDMLANYMDYTASCWDTYTAEQTAKMRHNVFTERQALISNAEACNGVLDIISIIGCASYNVNSELGPGNQTIINIDGFNGQFPNISGNSQTYNLCVYTSGDNNLQNEQFDIYNEDLILLGTTTASNGDCTKSPEICFEISSSEYNNWMTDGLIEVIIDPIDTGVNPLLCGTSNQACASIVITESDCNNSISFSGLPSTSGSAVPIDLMGNPSGGVFSGNGIIFNAFNPLIAGPGQHEINYTYTDSTGCEESVSQSIIVFTLNYNFVNYNLGTISP